MGIDPFTTKAPADVLMRAITVTYVTVMVCQQLGLSALRQVTHANNHGGMTLTALASPIPGSSPR